MSEKPLVSIVCVSMNHEKYVEQGLRSFLNQTYPSVEILYLDNASQDSSFEIASKVFETTHIPLKSLKRERTYNLPENFNLLVKKARGKYVCLIFCDDWMKDDYIERMVEEYEKQPHIGMLYSNGWYYWEETDKYELAENKKFISGNIFDHVFLHKVIFPVGVFIKKEVFDVVGLYDESIVIEDYDMWLRIAAKYEIGYSKTPAIYYRKHNKSLTLSSTCKNIKYYIQTAEKYKSHKLFERVHRDFRKLYIYCHYVHGERQKAFKLIAKDFRFERFYFSVIYKLVLSKFGHSDSQKKRFD